MCWVLTACFLSLLLSCFASCTASIVLRNLSDVCTAVLGTSRVPKPGCDEGTLLEFSPPYNRIHITSALEEILGEPLPDPNDPGAQGVVMPAHPVGSCGVCVIVRDRVRVRVVEMSFMALLWLCSPFHSTLA